MTNIKDTLEEADKINARESSLEEFCRDRLPKSDHGVNRELRMLLHCREHPLRWWIWDMKRKFLPFINWRSPCGK